MTMRGGGLRKMAGAILVAGLLAAGALAMPAAAADYGHHVLGDTTAKTPGKVQPGLLLMGGGDRNFDALHWFMRKAGNGHIVVLRASQGGEIGEEFFNEVGGIASVETYVFTDRGTWLSFRNRADLTILVEGDKALFNQYGVMVVNPARHPHVKQAAAQAFADWVTSPAGQASIASYKVGGEQLFFPNAPR